MLAYEQFFAAPNLYNFPFKICFILRSIMQLTANTVIYLHGPGKIMKGEMYESTSA